MSTGLAEETGVLPAPSHTRTRVTARAQVPMLLRVRKVDWPEQAALIGRLDELKAREGYRHDSALAEAAGISPTAISNWRNSKVKPSYVSISAVARALNEQPNALATIAGILGEDAPTERIEQLPAAIERLGRLYREADDDRRADLLKQVDVVNAWFEATERKTPRRRAG